MQVQTIMGRLVLKTHNRELSLLASGVSPVQDLEEHIRTTQEKINRLQSNLDLMNRAHRKLSVEEGLPVSAVTETGVVAYVLMQDIVGDYENPEDVPEWVWVEGNASFSHMQIGQAGIYEFVLNLAKDYDEVPEKLQAVMKDAKSKGCQYIIFHQGT